VDLISLFRGAGTPSDGALKAGRPSSAGHRPTGQPHRKRTKLQWSRRSYEVSSASWPRRRQAHRGWGEVSRRHHHFDTAKEKPSQGEVIAVG